MVVRVRKAFKKEFLIKNINNVISKPLNINKENSNVLRLKETKYFQNQDEIIVDYIPHMRQRDKLEIKTKINYIGVVRVDPNVYAKLYADSIIESEKLPDYVKKIPNPPGIELVRIF